MLRWLDLVDSWPEIVSTHAICCSCFVFVPVLLARVRAAAVFVANRMMAMGPAVVSHVARVPEITFAAAAACALSSFVTVSVVVFVW